ncbi:MAG: metallophosphoesterase family protein [Pseudobdellovibrio sp.]
MKLLAALFFILPLAGCQTSSKKNPQPTQQTFQTFEIKKITEHGLQSLEIAPSAKEWPDVDFDDVVPLPFKSENLKFAVVGDTGCRLKESNGKNVYQNCADENEWPYKTVIKSLMNEKFDFMIHTGDYHYREQCSDRTICPRYTRSFGYNWAAWWDDFYGPNQELFKKTPMLLVRGNHEDCTRAYAGWEPISVFNKQFDEKCEQVEPFQWIEIDDMVIVNFDDAGFDEKHETSKAEQARFLIQFKEISERISQLKTKKEIWLVTHKPVFAFLPSKDKSGYTPASRSLKAVLDQSDLLPKIDYILSGHVHTQQLVMNRDGLRQIIVANSGTALEPFGKKIRTNKLISLTDNENGFGYAMFERLGFRKWQVQFKNRDGKTEMECHIQDKKIKCQP